MVSVRTVQKTPLRFAGDSNAVGGEWACRWIRTGFRQWGSAVWVGFEKGLELLAIEFLVAVLIPIPQVRFGAQPKSQLHEVDLAVAVQVAALQGEQCGIDRLRAAGDRRIFDWRRQSGIGGRGWGCRV